MKKLTAILITGSLIFGLAGLVFGQSDDSDATVTVGSIDLIDVTDGGTITLDHNDATAGSNTVGPDTDASAALNYTHNSATNKKITAEATTNPGGHDITLEVDVTGGAGYQTIVNSGTAQAAQTVYTGIAAGVVSAATVTYRAQCTASGTPAGNYDFTVTFTASDV